VWSSFVGCQRQSLGNGTLHALCLQLPHPDSQAGELLTAIPLHATAAGGVETDVQVYAISPPPSDTNAASTSGGQHEVLSPTGGLRRSAQERVALLRFDGRSAQLGCLSGGKTLEIFRCGEVGQSRSHNQERSSGWGAGSAC
jgi:hypothetical protein